MTVDAPQRTLLTFTEYAARRRWSQPRVSQLVKAGRLPVVWLIPGDRRSRRIDAEAADAALERSEDPASPMTGMAPALGNVVDLAARRAVPAADGFAAART